jgi:hypothetical protein
MARLYRLYRFRGSQVISWAVLQPLGVAETGRQPGLIYEIVSDFAPIRDFFNGMPRSAVHCQAGKAFAVECAILNTTASRYLAS